MYSQSSQRSNELTADQLSYIVIGEAIETHKSLGPGLLESSYKEVLYYRLTKIRGLSVEKEKALPLIHEEVKLDIGYRIDLFVEGKLIVEIKAVDALADIHTAQTLTYIKLSGCKLALLINFNVVQVKDGIKRLIL